MPPTRSASALLRARPCCGGAPISIAPAALPHWPRKSPKTPPPPKSSAAPVSRCGWSIGRSRSRSAGARAAEVWNRQLRWARLRRASFLLYFLPEILSGGVLPMIAVAIVANGLGLSAVLERGTVRRVLVRRRNAACGRRRMAGLRTVPALWAHARSVAARALCQRSCAATISSGAATKCRSNACGRGDVPDARVMRRPRMQEIAQGSRRRLRALRARALSSG